MWKNKIIIYTPTSVCIFYIYWYISQGADKENLSNNLFNCLISDHFLYSHDPNVWFRGNIMRRNYMHVTPGTKGLIVITISFFLCAEHQHRMSLLYLALEYKWVNRKKGSTYNFRNSMTSKACSCKFINHIWRQFEASFACFVLLIHNLLFWIFFSTFIFVRIQQSSS